jgi:ABC-2 type transport system ATP-binding protein
MAIPDLRAAVPPPDTPNAIEVDHIVKKFGDFTAVDDVSFLVKEGEIFGLLGPNGAGKSTLIRMMTTLIPITSGVARIAGHDVRTDPDDARRVIGVIPQALTSDIDLTVEENMSIYAKLYDVPAKKRKQAIDELLELVDLTKWRDAQTKTLSGGMRRRLEIARGLVHSPKIFFLDEPTTGLDPVSRVAVWEMLMNIKSHRQLTILITTHYMDEADRLCDRIAIMDHGRILALDTPEGLRRLIPGGTVLEIAVRVSQATLVGQSGEAETSAVADHFRMTLERQPGVTMVEQVSRSATEENRAGSVLYRVYATQDAGALLASAAQAVIQEQGELLDLRVARPSLEDVFIHLTGRALRS